MDVLFCSDDARSFSRCTNRKMSQIKARFKVGVALRVRVGRGRLCRNTSQIRAMGKFCCRVLGRGTRLQIVRGGLVIDGVLERANHMEKFQFCNLERATMSQTMWGGMSLSLDLPVLPFVWARTCWFWLGCGVVCWVFRLLAVGCAHRLAGLYSLQVGGAQGFFPKRGFSLSLLA